MYKVDRREDEELNVKTTHALCTWHTNCTPEL